MHTPQQPHHEKTIDLGRGTRVESAKLRVSFSRSSGPGGQSVNKLNTKAELRVAVTDISGLSKRMRSRLRDLAGQRHTQDDEILIAADTHRSQGDNKRECIERLSMLVTKAATLPKKRKRTRPSRAAREKRLKRKREQSEKKKRRGWKPE